MVLCVNYSGYQHYDKLKFFKKENGNWVSMSSVKKDGIMCTQLISSHTPYMAARYDTCSDGTPYGECSSDKPKYCDDGNLVDKCDICGCDSGYRCRGDGTCYRPSTGGGGYTIRCGDGICTVNVENCSTCPQDCGECPSQPICGNGIVEEGEECDGGARPCTVNGYHGSQACVDCSWGKCVATESCGDGVCNGPETNDTCPEDCALTPTGSVCGNGICEEDEVPYDPKTGVGCLPDCGHVPGCGDGVCTGNETCSTCPQDCGECPPSGPTGFALLRNPGVVIPAIVILGLIIYWIFFASKRKRKKRKRR